MDSASIQKTIKIIPEQNGISLFKMGHRKHWLELLKVDGARLAKCKIGLAPVLGHRATFMWAKLTFFNS